jgi:hypothetical protein
MNWRQRFEKHSQLGVDFGAARRSSAFGSDFEHPMVGELAFHPGATVPERVHRQPDYVPTGMDVVGGSRFGLGVVIPSTYKPHADAPPPDVPTADTGFGQEVAKAQRPTLVKAILAAVGLFFVGLFVDHAAKKALGEHHKPIVLFKR